MQASPYYTITHPQLLMQSDSLKISGGVSRIRTHGCFHITDFQDQHLKPLGHHSAFYEYYNTISQCCQYVGADIQT